VVRRHLASALHRLPAQDAWPLIERLARNGEDRESLPVFIRLLDEPALRPAALGVLARFDSPEIPVGLIERFGVLPQD